MSRALENPRGNRILTPGPVAPGSSRAREYEGECCLWRTGQRFRRLHRAEDLPVKAVARVLGMSKNMVKAALVSDAPPKYERPQRASVADEVKLRIRELLQVYPWALRARSSASRPR